MKSRSLILVVVSAILAAQTACSRVDPRHPPIQSSTASAYDRWRMRTSHAFRVEEWGEFDSMLQELRLRIMANREVSGRDKIEASLRAKVDGVTFREVLVMGYQAKLVRLGNESRNRPPTDESERPQGGSARLVSGV
jgi:hypothetical protein